MSSSSSPRPPQGTPSAPTLATGPKARAEQETAAWLNPAAAGNATPHLSAAGAEEVSDEPSLPAELVKHPRYRIVHLLGVGGMGTVYQAEHLLMGRMVALKVINPRFVTNPAAVERFQREVRSAARLKHPNIVTAFDAEQAGSTHFFVMEYVEGESLASVLRRDGALAVREACDAIRQAALGLQHAHEQGMVHRDIKPDNLMRTPQGQIKILDFGLVRVGRPSSAEIVPLPETEPSPDSQLTQAGSVMGTPDYIAPEQANDSSRADIRSDIYSLGCSLYQLLTGRVPYPKGNALKKLARKAKPPRPIRELCPKVPARLATVVEKMMAPKPTRRYQTPEEVARALEPWCQGRQPRRWWRIAAGALFLLVLFALLFVVGKPHPGTLTLTSGVEGVEVVAENEDGHGHPVNLRPGDTLRAPPGPYRLRLKPSEPSLRLEPERLLLPSGGHADIKVIRLGTESKGVFQPPQGLPPEEPKPTERPFPPRLGTKGPEGPNGGPNGPGGPKGPNGPGGLKGLNGPPGEEPRGPRPQP